MTASSNTPVRGVSPFHVGNQAQLFIDQVLVRSTERVWFRLHPAQKHVSNPLLKAERPWEGWRLEIYGSVLYDEDERVFKMWYLGETPEIPEYPLLYATSQDGIHWEKPPVGTVPLTIAQQHNVVATGAVIASVIKDNRDPHPGRRYKMICWRQQRTRATQSDNQQEGYHTMVSPDGLHWQPLSREPIAPHSDVITGYYDRQRQVYVAFPKTHAADVAGLPQPRRVFSVITSTDFETWSEPELAFVPDERDDAGSLARIEEVRPLLDVPDNPALMRTEFYGIGVYQAESCTLAFPWVFTINNDGRYGNQEGPAELQLAVSRDLKHWERPFRLPCVPRGKLGDWDCGFFGTAAEALRVGDEVWLYYAGSNYTHGTPCLYRAEGTGRKTKYTGSIGLATWKLDRFVSVEGPAEGGTLTTVPIAFSGERLVLNAKTNSAGAVVVEVLDLAGHTLARSRPFSGDELGHRVEWEQPLDLQRLAGAAISLKFHLRSAELYAFAFRGR